MSAERAARVAALIGKDGSLSPLEVAAAAQGLAEVTFVLDPRDLGDDFQGLYQVAASLRPTVTGDFRDFPSCLSLMTDIHAAAAVTFVDRYCSLAARLNSGFDDPEITWGRKDRQRELLVDAGVSSTRHALVRSEQDLRSFAHAVGFPVIVKPPDGVSSRELWLLQRNADIDSIVGALASGPVRLRDGMLAEEFIAGQQPAEAHIADYVSAEVFRSGLADSADLSFVTDRLVPAWPCREAGLVLPTRLPSSEQRQVIGTAARALDALRATRGAFHVEVKPRAPVPEVVEVNGRLGGFIARAVRYASETDLGRIAIAAALGLDEARSIAWQRCVLLLHFQAPAAAVRITAAPRRRDLVRLPEVLVLEELQPPGTRLNWRRGTGEAVASVWFAADDHEVLHRKLVRIAEYLTVHFEFADENGNAVKDMSWLERVAARPSANSPGQPTAGAVT